MNSVIVAKAIKSVIPSFVEGELITNAEKDSVIIVTRERNDKYFSGMVLFSTRADCIGKHTVGRKVDFELFNEVLELSN